MQLLIQRLHLFPEARGLVLELSRAHVIASAPHFAEVAVAEFARPLVGQLDIALRTSHALAAQSYASRSRLLQARRNLASSASDL